MGDLRFGSQLQRLKRSADPVREMQEMDDGEVIAALAAASRESDPYLANVLATEALNRAQRKDLIMRAMGEGVYAIDANGCVTYANEAAGRLLGRSRATMEGKPLHVLLHPGRDHDGPCLPPRVLRGEAPAEAEDTYVRPDGTAFPVRLTAAPLVRNGEADGAVVVFRDVTERRRALSQLEEAQARVRTLLDHLPAILFSVDRDGRFTLSEGRGLQPLGFHGGEVVGRSLFDLYAEHPDVIAQARRALEGEPVEGRAEVGHLVFDVCWRPMRDDEGRANGAVGVALDVTERRRAEIAERDARERAERAVARMQFLAEANLAVGETLDPEEAMRRLAGACVPFLADWCAVHVPREDGRWEAVAAAGGEADAPRRSASAPGAHPHEPALREAVEAGRAQTTEVQRAPGDVRQLVVAPIAARGKSLGALTLAMGSSGRRFAQDDAPLAEEVARRAATALDNAFLFRAEREARGEAEAAVRGIRASMSLLHVVKERYRALVSAVPQTVFTLDAEQGVVWPQPDWEALTGQAPEGYRAWGWISAVHPDDRERTRAILETAIQEDRPAAFEHRLRARGGEFRRFRVHAVPVRDQARRAREWVVSHTDVTDRLRAEERLRESEARYRSLVEHMRDVVFVLDAETGTFVSLNPAFEVLTGHDRAAWIGRPYADIVHPDDRSLAQAKYGRALDGFSPAPFELRLLTRAGGTVTLEVSATPWTRDGRVIHVAGVARDVTDRKQAEAEAARLRERLEERVRERTIQLADANAELEAFSASVAHDLRAPLRGIQQFAALLDEDHGEALGADGRDLLDRLVGEAHRATSLVNDLLAFSRAARGDLTTQRVDLGEMARNVLASLARAHPERRVETRVADGLEAQADPRLLRIVLENLIGNAWKFTQRTPAARIEVDASDEQGRPVFHVRDNGAGFEPEKASLLFRPFLRLHSPRDYEGTGMGLATVQRIVRRHGGRIWAHSPGPGKGATFSFTLGNE